MNETNAPDVGGAAVLIIAEVGSVHDGSFGNALRLIDVATECGADVVKFQTHISAAETLRDAPMPAYFKGEPRYAYFERTGFSLGQWLEMKAHCDDVGIEFLSSPFSIEAVDLLERVGVTRYKVPSGEGTNLPFLNRVGETGKPVLLSSGMSTWAELDGAVEAIRAHHDRITVLQCSSEYPCLPERVGLNVLQEMKERYGLPVGLSDHTMTAYSSYAAAVLGATVIEKHLTFSRKMYGSDAKHSLEPQQFAELVAGVRAIEAMLAARVDKDDVERYAEMKHVFEKSIVAAADIAEGTVLTREMLAFKKPGTGISASRAQDMIGKRTRRPIAADTLLEEDSLDGP
ncbi:N-acetylneuraminate synthase family protein [Candidatus Bipolaricaulota bacterium]|nr:N-acetylneuraminate synthase family protein [Candidatus Bipolaricaulota bacterium]